MIDPKKENRDPRTKKTTVHTRASMTKASFRSPSAAHKALRTSLVYGTKRLLKPVQEIFAHINAKVRKCEGEESQQFWAEHKLLHKKWAALLA